MEWRTIRDRARAGAVRVRARVGAWLRGGPRVPGRPGRVRLPTWRQVGLGVVLLAAFLWLLWERCGIAGCPNVERLVSYQPGGASVLLDQEGEPFADLSPVGWAVVPLESLPAYVPEAFLAVEDKRFHEHGGVDWRRVFGALAADLRAGGFVQGFSTITMQLARNVFPERLPGQERTPWRKLLEVRVAREIEDRFTKAEILELYLNHIYFGEGAYGIEAAARNYFDRPAERLTLAQAALLAALVKGPAIYSPRRHPERARARRNLVLSLMAAQGRATPEEVAAASDAGLGVRRTRRPRTAEPGFAPYFADAVRRVLEERFGEEIYTAPLRIHTTLDRRAQRAAEQALARQLAAIEDGVYGRAEGERYRADAEAGDNGTGYLQGAVVVLAADSGDVLALVGGRDYRHSPFNRATRARRQLGSAFRPFVYAAALSEGYAPSQQLADAPLRMELAGGEVWEPHNFTGEFEGTVTLRDALVRSKNVPTVRLAAAVGTGEVARLARAAGLEGPIPVLPSMALGTASATPLQAAAAYTPFANLGMAVEPRFVLRIEGPDSNVVWKSRGARRRRVLEPAVAYLLTDMLEDALDEGTGAGVRRAGYRGVGAGKTGTTNDGTDAWFVGYTPDLVASVWIGFDRPQPIVSRATGGRLAAPVWGRLMRQIYRDREAPERWEAPEQIIERRVDPSTGLVLAEGCDPARGRARREIFIRGMGPAASCPRGGEREAGPSVLDRVVAWVRNAWSDASRWLASHFGREEDSPAASRRDRFLGTPRLPRVDEVPTPEVSPELYRAPTYDLEITIPEGPPLAPETAGVPEVLGEPEVPGGPVPPPGDTLPPVPADSGRAAPAPDTATLSPPETVAR